MKISTQTRYAVRLLLELALHEEVEPKGNRLTAEEIARRQGISEKYLESIAAKLRKGGFILSAKGVNGGYLLAKPAAHIRLGDVMRLMESTYFAVHCVADPAVCCPNYNGCVLARVWESLEETVSRALDGVSLEDVKRQCEDGRAGNWGSL